VGVWVGGIFGLQPALIDVDGKVARIERCSGKGNAGDKADCKQEVRCTRFDFR
jgi:hypothetical protein